MSIFEMRTDTLTPNMTQPDLQFHHEEGSTIHVRHLGPSVGWWQSEVGALNQIVMLWPTRTSPTASAAAPRLRPMANGRPSCQRRPPTSGNNREKGEEPSGGRWRAPIASWPGPHM